MKALICKHPDIYQSIVGTHLPARAKNLTRDIVKTPEWDAMVVTVMEELLYCKFKYNKQLYYHLAS